MVTPQSVQGHTGLTHHFFKFLTFGRSGAQSWAPERPNVENLKNAGLNQYGPERFGSLILLQSEKCGTERVNALSIGQVWYNRITPGACFDTLSVGQVWYKAIKPGICLIT